VAAGSKVTVCGIISPLDARGHADYRGVTMAGKETVERVAGEIIAAVTSEFNGVSVRLDFDAETGDHEDAFLWITAGTDDREEINEIWGYAIKLVQDAYNEEDVYLVARMKGVGVIDRERSMDADF
jgi:hypothetical protein